MTDIQLFDKLGVQSHPFDVEINARTREEFVKQFRDMCSCSTATELRGIVYTWSTSKKIPRMRGESRVPHPLAVGIDSIGVVQIHQ